MPNNSLLPSGLQWAGALLSPFYGLGVAAHRALSSVKSAPLPVLCIGNLTVGGTGKTPAAKYFARGLSERGYKPAVLMRGYKEQGSDEAREIENAVKALGIPVLIGGDRYASACKAKELNRDCVLLDDGFQHWKLLRDLDIVLIDATNPFGGERLIPNGRLREPMKGLRRAGAVILSRSDLVSPTELESIESRVKTLAPNATLVRAIHAPVESLVGESSTGVALERLKGAHVVAACGIGNPEAFRKTLERMGATIAEFVALPDHFKFDEASLNELCEKVKRSQSQALVVTEKDAVKLDALNRPAEPTEIWVVRIEFKIVRNELELWNRIDAVLRTKLGK